MEESDGDTEYASLPETSSLGISFVKKYRPQADLVWDFIESQLPATWLEKNPPDDDTIVVVVVVNQDQGATKLISPDVGRRLQLGNRNND